MAGKKSFTLSWKKEKQLVIIFLKYIYPLNSKTPSSGGLGYEKS